MLLTGTVHFCGHQFVTVQGSIHVYITFFTMIVLIWFVSASISA